MLSLQSRFATRPHWRRGFACGACALALFGSSVPALDAQPRPVESPMLPSDGSTQVLWQRVFASAADDWINDIVAMHDGSFMAVGYLDRQETKSDWRALAVQLRDSGDIIAAREYGAGGGVDAFWSMRSGSSLNGWSGSSLT